MIEIWKRIIKHKGYSVSNLGRIRKFKYNEYIIIKPTKNRTGYLTILFFRGRGSDSKKYSVHRLVAKYFLNDYDDNLEIHHINGNKLDNRASNLKCVTRDQHIKYNQEKS